MCYSNTYSNDDDPEEYTGPNVKCNAKSIKYNFEYDPSCDIFRQKFADDGWTAEQIDAICGLFDAAVTQGHRIDIPYRCIIINNNRGINHDRRGANACGLKLPFYSRVSISDGTSVSRMIGELWRLKSHKFENWYEYVIGVEDEKVVDDVVMYDLCDHGS